MNFLAPLYALAALGIVVPIVLHLVRKRPKEKLEFSSLLFLTASPPRLTRRSQIDHWLLLMLRAGTLVLLALAFARPYWMSAGEPGGNSQPGMRRIVLIDQSASMRRPGVWTSATEEARRAIEASQVGDVVAVYGYSDFLAPVVPLSAAVELPVAQRVETAVAGLSSMQLTWGGSQLGNAIHGCVDLLQADQTRSDDQGARRTEIVVVSDLQASSELASLSQLDWPAETSLRVLRVGSTELGNAHFSFLSQEPDSDSGTSANEKSNSERDDAWRVRVTNEPGSKREALQLRWLDSQAQAIQSTSTDCRVAEGSTRVIRIPPPPDKAIALELTGDDCDFDNRRYLVTDPSRASTVRCIDVAPEKPEESLWYFLSRLPLGSSSHSVQIKRLNPGDPWSTARNATEPWLVASHHLPITDGERCREFLEAGGHMLWVWDTSADSQSPIGALYADHYTELTNSCTGVELGRVAEAKVKQYSLLSRLDFQSPVFSPLSGAQFNDFSKVRFWKHRELTLATPEDWRVLAWFDSNTPALIERSVGRGRLCILTAGWQPIESQLALSSKFVPLLSSLFAQARPERESKPEWIVGQRYALSPGVEVRAANGNGIGASSSDPLDSNASVAVSSPGIYERVSGGIDVEKIAANISPSESITTALDLAEFNRFGVQVSSAVASPLPSSEAKRQMVATEIESKQSGWWWLITAALFAVGIESIIGWRRKPIPNPI